MKLISMTDFVLQQMQEVILEGTGVVCARIGNYAKFLKQPLSLGMFIPCDEDDNPLFSPIAKNYFRTYIPFNEFNESDIEGLNEYHVALMVYEGEERKTLFKGFESSFESNIRISGKVYFDRKESKLFSFYHNVFRCQSASGTILKTVNDLIKYDLELTESAIQQIK